MADLARAAAAEVAGREEFYPEMVRARELTAQEAQLDWRCWKAISEWLADPQRQPHLSDWDLSWSDWVAAARRALARREEALAGANDQNRAALEQRRDAVKSICLAVEREARIIADLNRELKSPRQAAG
jgi:hypothetical protein